MQHDDDGAGSGWASEPAGPCGCRMTLERFVLNIDMGNAAMNDQGMVALALAATDLRKTCSKIYDHNGNSVGYWAFVSDDVPESGDEVVVEGTITGEGPSGFKVTVTVEHAEQFFWLSERGSRFQPGTRLLVRVCADDQFCNLVAIQ